MRTKPLKILWLTAGLTLPMSVSVSACAQDAEPPAQAVEEATQEAAQEAVPALVPALEKFSPLIGTFDISGVRYTPDGEVPLRPTKSATQPIMGGFALQDMSQIDVGSPELMGLQSTITYDQFRNVYRVTLLDDTLGLMDVYEGNFDSDNVLSVTNLRSNTYFPIGPNGEAMHFKLRWDLGASPITYDLLTTVNGGESWDNFSKMTYTKTSDSASAKD